MARKWTKVSQSKNDIVLVQKLFAILLVGLYAPCILGQNTPGESKDRDTTDFLIGYPVVFYFPETRLGFGASGLYTFRVNQDTLNNTSNMQLGFGYTQNRQLLIFYGYKFFLKENQQQFTGELGYYDYFYPFYGIGPETSLEDEEFYFVKFPRLKTQYLFRLGKPHLIGPAIHYDYYKITQIDPEGILASEEVYGRNGGHIAGLGVAYQFDRRNKQFYPSEGSYVESSFVTYSSHVLSSYGFGRFDFSYSKYNTLYKRLVLVSNLYLTNSFGSPPFQELARFGGPRTGRGYVVGRFVDRHQAGVQMELRHPLIWRFKLHLFGSVGNVYNEQNVLDYFDSLKWNGGIGLRFLLDKDDLLHMRFDYGRSNEGGELYITIGEAF